MIKTKKKLTVELNKAVEPLIRKNKNLIRIKDKAEFLLYLEDIDSETEFYFGIVKETSDSQGHNIHVSFKPRSSTNNASLNIADKLDVFSRRLESWLSIISFYSQESILDDPILTQYENEYFNDYKIVNEDADTISFNYSQQLLLDAYLTQIINGVDEYKDEQNSHVIEEIKSEANTLQLTITTQTQNEFMRGLSKIFAKGRKAGLKASNFIMKEFLKSVAEKGTNWIFNFAVTHANEIPAYIHQLTVKLLGN